MADVARSLDGVDLQAADGKTKEHKAILFSDMLAKDEMRKASGEETIIEPIMVRDASGKKCLYYFEGGNHHWLEVVEGDTDAVLPDKIQEVEVFIKRMWREALSIPRVITSFFVLFVVEFIWYLTHHVFQPLMLNSVSVVGNHLLKPSFIAVFNNLAQPTFAFVWNVLNGFVSTLKPILELTTTILKQAAMVLQSFRLFNVNYHSAPVQRELEAV